MHSRILALHAAMCRLADLIDDQPGLRARAAESTAFAHFLEVIATFESLRTEEETSDIQLRALRAQRRALLDDVVIALRGIQATAALIPTHATPLPDMAPPDRRLSLARFTQAATGYVGLVRQHFAAFVDAGLHPHAMNDALALIDQLIDVDRRSSYGEARFLSLPSRLELVVNDARKRVRQLYFELRPVMTAPNRVHWRYAATLGRVHRPNALTAGAPLKRLPAPAEVHDILAAD